MYNENEVGPTSDEFDPDAVLWVRGVSYVAGWRDARDAGADLIDALQDAQMDTDSLKLRADANADGSGRVQLSCSPQLARELALLARVTVAQLRRAS